MKGTRKMAQSERGNRPIVETGSIVNANGEIMNRLIDRLRGKGAGAWLSRHEILGIITEEYHEFIEASHSRNREQMKQELIDIAVGCIFAVACINDKTLDW
jgi:uncharacterized protein YabN with tetrapyrrole methylase and pyrophosphatase domain